MTEREVDDWVAEYSVGHQEDSLTAVIRRCYHDVENPLHCDNNAL